MKLRMVKVRLAMTLCGPLLFLAALAVPAWCHDTALRLSDRTVIEFPRQIAELKGSDYLFLGENHDNEWHHQLQLTVIKGLHELEVPVAIGLEMVTAERQAELDRWVAGSMGIEEFRAFFEQEWTLPWRFYADILFYARQQRIPLVGINIPREITRKVMREGFATLTPAERQRLPKNVTCTVDASYLAFIRKAFADHGKDDKAFRHFCEAQMLWDSAMAQNLSAYRRKNPGWTVVVLAGIGHVLKRGLPEQVRREDRPAFRVLVPELADFTREKVTLEDADYLFLSH